MFEIFKSFVKTNPLTMLLITFCFLGLSIIGALYCKNSNLKREISALNSQLLINEANLQILQANLSECNSKLGLQNEKIKQISIDNENLKENSKKLKKELNIKYKKISPPADMKDDKKLKEYYESVFEELSK
jgi:hypothetical protein